jgi:hypothetical protein
MPSAAVAVQACARPPSVRSTHTPHGHRLTRAVPPVPTQLLEGAPDDEVRDVAALLEALDQQLAAATNFEFCQAVLQAALAVHGEAIMEQRLLKDAAQRLKARLQGDWRRLDELLQGVRCMVDFFGNLQM